MGVSVSRSARVAGDLVEGEEMLDIAAGVLAEGHGLDEADVHARAHAPIPPGAGTRRH